MSEQASTVVKQKKGRILPYLATLSFLFFVIQLSAYLTTSPDISFILSLVNKHQIKVPRAVIFPELTFAAAQLGLYVTYTLVIWVIARLAASFFNCSWKKAYQLSFLFWLICSVSVLLANQLLCPSSEFGTITATVIPTWLAKTFLGAGLLVIAGMSLCACLQVLKWFWQQGRLLRIVVLALGGGAYFLFQINQPAIAKEKAKNDLPNIIFIGVDSLRPDYTAINGPNPGSETPNLDQFLQHATVFTDAITPLARTYPSWTAILTGLYPIHNGVRFNLQNQQGLSLPNSIEDLLKKEGYTSYYATDERRFSNISYRFGFDHIIGPDMGVNDFILGTFNDFPLSNLVVNTRIGHWLFPYSAGNRAAYRIYRPQTFNDIVEAALLKEQGRPLFLSIHFCLPHWPYAWANQAYDDKLFPGGLYALAAHRADEQAGEFIEFLQTNHFLDHAIVVVLSDHGEGILRPDDRLIYRKTFLQGDHSDSNVFQALDTLFGFRGYKFDTSYGHGSDILSYVQFHTVLAFRTFGFHQNNLPAKIAAPVATIDIEPTILSLIHVPPPHLDGLSLTPFMFGHPIDLSKRVLLGETEYNPVILQAHSVDIKGTVLQGLHMFQVNPSCAMVMNLEGAKKVLIVKQRAVLYKNWIFALYPQKPPKVVAVILNRTTGEWTDDLGSPFARTAPLPFLMQQMAKLYGKEVTAYCPYLSGCIKMS